MSAQSILQRVFSDLEAFEEMNNFLRDITAYRKSVMRVWITKEVITDLRSVIPTLPASLTLARDTVLSLFEDLPLCKSGDPETSIERLKSYFEMKNPKSVVVSEYEDQTLAQQIRLLTQLLVKGSAKPNENQE